MPDDFGSAEEIFFKRLDKMREHKLLMILKGIKCKCVFCAKSDNKNNKISPVSLF